MASETGIKSVVAGDLHRPILAAVRRVFRFQDSSFDAVHYLGVALKAKYPAAEFDTIGRELFTNMSFTATELGYLRALLDCYDNLNDFSSRSMGLVLGV